MNYKVISSVLLVGGVAAFWTRELPAQVKPITISPLIGDTLDVLEQRAYRLFPLIPGFRRAVFRVTPDSLLSALITWNRNGIEADSTIPLRLTHSEFQKHLERREQLLLDSAKQAGREVVMSLDDTVEVRAELLSVRDTALLVDTTGIESVTTLRRGLAGISRIRRVVLPGASFTLLGVLAGGSVGIAIAEIAKQEPNERASLSEQFGEGFKNVLLFGLLGLFGAGLGGIVAEGLSREHIDLSFPTPSDLQLLRPYSRYRAGEPLHIRNIR